MKERLLAVFCGSAFGKDPAFARAARAVGTAIAARGAGLVYGGGGVGLMKEVADACLEGGGRVVGVIPKELVRRELAHGGKVDLRVVPGMHERKALMAELASAFLSLPGGYGTLDETFEILTWAQLGFHAKPIGLLDVAGFFGPLVAALDAMAEAGFVRREHRALVNVFDDPAVAVEALAGRHA